MADVKTVAEFMTRVLAAQGELFQQDIAFEIYQRFGKGFIHKTELDDLAINPDVLKEFRAMNPRVKYSLCVWRLKDEHED
jgi:hypothetical protein